MSPKCTCYYNSFFILKLSYYVITITPNCHLGTLIYDISRDRDRWDNRFAALHMYYVNQRIWAIERRQGLLPWTVLSRSYHIIYSVINWVSLSWKFIHHCDLAKVACWRVNSSEGSESKKAMTMLGLCPFTIQEGRFTCSCKTGVHAHSLSSIDLSELYSPCSNQNHPAPLHFVLFYKL